jgi:hypothetical protein
MGSKSTFMRLVTVSAAVLGGAGEPLGQENLAAAKNTAPANLFYPYLVIDRRPASKSEVADTQALDSFVAIRLTSAPTYDPAFRLPDHLARKSRPASLARHQSLRPSRRPDAPPKLSASAGAKSSVSEEWPNLSSLIQRLSQPLTRPVNVMLPADK